MGGKKRVTSIQSWKKPSPHKLRKAVDVDRKVRNDGKKSDPHESYLKEGKGMHLSVR